MSNLPPNESFPTAVEPGIIAASFDELPVGARLSALHEQVNYFSKMVATAGQDQDPEDFSDMANDYAALIQMRAALYLEEQGLDQVAAETLADKILGEGMHLMRDTGLPEMSLRGRMLSDGMRKGLDARASEFAERYRSERAVFLEEAIMDLKELQDETGEDQTRSIQDYEQELRAIRSETSGQQD